MKRTIVSLGMLMVVGCGQREVLRFVPVAPGYAVEPPSSSEGSGLAFDAARERVHAASRLSARIAAAERALREPEAAAPRVRRASAREGSAQSAAEPSPTAPPTLVNLNSATLAELEALPRVGPAMAARIVAKRPFRRPEDLRRVSGIGPSTLRALRPLVTVTPSPDTAPTRKQVH